jgi:hypothetical protein
LAAIVWFFGSAAFGFEYSEADLQHVSAASVAASVDGPTTPFMQTALLSKMAAQGAVRGGSLTLAGVQSGFQKILSQGSSSPAAQVASDAYMIYCHTVNITVMEDLAADGPLHLMGIADPDFVAYDVGKPMMPGGLVNRISLGNQAGKADETAKIEKTNLQPLRRRYGRDDLSEVLRMRTSARDLDRRWRAVTADHGHRLFYCAQESDAARVHHHTVRPPSSYRFLCPSLPSLFPTVTPSIRLHCRCSRLAITA